MQKMEFLMASLILLPVLVFAQSYILKSKVIDEGGEKVTSSGYICKLSIAQQTASQGWIESSNYKAILGFWNSSSASGVEEYQEIIPSNFYLSQNHPNPAIAGTYIKYALPEVTKVTLEVYDAMGRAVRTLIEDTQKPGIYKIYWDGTNRRGVKVSSGIYFYRMEARGFRNTKKMIVVR
jgi:hypothetical protein